MSDKWKPSILIAVDAMTDELASEEGRDEILKKNIYLKLAEVSMGIPSDLVKVEQVKPLSLNDLAINDAVEIDKKNSSINIWGTSFYFRSGRVQQR